MMGLEPMTSHSRSENATNCATSRDTSIKKVQKFSYCIIYYFTSFKMKKSLKFVYPLIGIFCLINCSECNNFVTPDKYGGNGDTDYQTYIEEFPKNSKDFENFIKFYGKPCVVKQFYPEQSYKDFFKPFEDSVLNETKRYEAYLLSTDDEDLSPGDQHVKKALLEKMGIIKESQTLNDKIKKAETNEEKGKLKQELKILIEENQYLLEPNNNLFKFEKLIESPVVLNNVSVKNFTSQTQINLVNDEFVAETEWTIEVENTGNDSFIKLHKYYLSNLQMEETEQDQDFLTIKFDKSKQQKLYFTYQSDLFADKDISKILEFGVIPKDFVTCSGNFKINVSLAPGFHLTHRWPYFEKQKTGDYQYVRSDRNAVNMDLKCVCGISKDEFLKTDITLTYKSKEPIQYLEGAMLVCNGPYKFKNCSISSNWKDNSSIPQCYDTTNLPAQNSDKFLYDTFDQEFYIKGVKSKTVSIRFSELDLIPDIKDRFYTGLDGQKGIIFGKTSNDILKIYANRILNESFCIGENACTCTKVAALSQFVNSWIDYQEHGLNHAMNPVKIFTFRKGICVDYTHLLMGLCSSIGINNLAKISGLGCNDFNEAEKHAWLLCYCPKCKHTFEFDPTWNFCYQTGPEHIYLSKTHRVNDTIERRVDGGEVIKDFDEIKFSLIGKSVKVKK